MAQWSQADRTLFAKIVYYGPALGGKTTNLQALHRITDPTGTNRLLSLATADDRTLFFDLLPFELGNVLGYKVAVKLYTVPGQVRYQATRRVVLSGADAVIFVADSSAAREADNRKSFDDLLWNLRANRLDPANVPILVQLNKRDLLDAAPKDVMASWFVGARNGAWPAVAIRGSGVVETLVVACKAMLERLMTLADRRTRQELDPGDLYRQIDRAFLPHMKRAAAGGAMAPGPSDGMVLDDRDILDSAVRMSVKLSDDLARANTRTGGDTRPIEQVRDRLLSTLMEESRAPLATIVSAATCMKDHDGPGEERREMAETILNAGEALQRLFGGVFRITGIDSGATDRDPAETSAAELVATASSLASVPPTSVEVDPRIGPMRAEIDKLAGALANLIDGAARISPFGSPVEVRATACALRSGSEEVAAVSFCVLDRGPSIVSGDVDRIGAVVENGEAFPTGGSTGFGMGLYESGTVARQSGGLLRYVAREGGGNEFRLVVPLVPPAAAALAKRPHSRAGTR